MKTTIHALLLVALAGGLSAQPTVTHGPISGDPLPDTVSIWARASGPALASVIHGTSPGLSNAAETTAVTVDASTDFSVRIDLSGLLPGTTHYYQVRLRDPGSPASSTLSTTARFKTAPAPMAASDLIVAFTADIRDLVHYPLFDGMTATSPDVTLFLGDWPYTDAAPAAATLAEYRQKHKDARTHPSIQALFNASALIPVWDDHEVQNDWDADTDPALVQLGRAVWKEYMPVRPNGDAIWRSLRFGTAAEFFILDCRSYRGSNEAPDVPGHTMLGPAQLAWLLSGLGSSTASFKFIVSSVPLRFGTTNKDHWQGFMRERRQIFEAIASQRIPGVVFISGDQHWSAVHHHLEGFKEFQACPLAANLREPPQKRDPEVVALHSARSYGVLRIQASAQPPTASFEIHDANGIHSTHTVRSEDPATIRIDLDEPSAGFLLEGPHRVKSDGASTVVPYAPSGTYTLRVGGDGPGVVPPGPLAMAVPPGGFLSAAAEVRGAEDSLHPVLFRDTFDGPSLSGWTVVDDGTFTTPSAWFADDSRLVQSSDIYGGSTVAWDPSKPGTRILAGSTSWTDITYSFRVRTQDNDGIGAIFRAAPDGSYYRFSMDDERNFRRLVRVSGGVTTTLAEVAGGYDIDQWTEVTIRAIGPALSVSVGGEPLFAVTDAAIPAGRIGLYCWQSEVVWFDDVVVRAGDAPNEPPGALLAADFSAGSLAGWTVVDQGTTDAPSAWSVQAGAVVQGSNIYGGSLVGADPNKPGTFLMTGSPAWGNVGLSARIFNADNDALGLMFRIQDADNYYRFSMDAERRYLRLSKTVAASTTTLAETSAGYTPNVWYRIDILADGPRLDVRLDGFPILSAMDSTFAAGRIALYSWNSIGARFDDLVVAPLDRSASVLAAHGDRNAAALQIAVPGWPGRSYVLGLSLASAPGIPLAALDPSDTRVIPLAVDPLLELSLAPQPFLGGFAGTLDGAGRASASIVPPVQLPPGFTIHASGLVLDVGQLSGIAAVLPALTLTFP